MRNLLIFTLLIASIVKADHRRIVSKGGHPAAIGANEEVYVNIKARSYGIPAVQPVEVCWAWEATAKDTNGCEFVDGNEDPDIEIVMPKETIANTPFILVNLKRKLSVVYYDTRFDPPTTLYRVNFTCTGLNIPDGDGYFVLCTDSR